MKRPGVSDHAVLRYLQRACGCDVEAVRRHIAERVRTGVVHGASAVLVDGVRFVLRGSTVVTVLERRWPVAGPREPEA